MVPHTFRSLDQLAINGFCGLYLANLSFFVLYELDISHSTGVTGHLYTLFWGTFPSLHSLILCDCGLNFEDLNSLAISQEEGKLPKLRSLDISQNDGLFAVLNLCSLDHNSNSLQYLKTLRISVCRHDYLKVSRLWKHLEQLEIVFLGNVHFNPTSTVVKAVEKGHLPCLKMVWFLSEGKVNYLHRPDEERLNRHGIFIKGTRAVGRIFSSRFSN